MPSRYPPPDTISQASVRVFSPVSKTETSFASIKVRRQKRRGTAGAGSGAAAAQPSPAQPARTAPPVPGHRSTSLRFLTSEGKSAHFRGADAGQTCRAKIPSHFHTICHIPAITSWAELFRAAERAILSQSEIRSTCPSVPIRQLELVQTKPPISQAQLKEGDKLLPFITGAVNSPPPPPAASFP